MFNNLQLPMLKTALVTAIAVACGGLGVSPDASAQQYGNSLRPVAQNRSVSSTQVRPVQPVQRQVVTRTTQVNRQQVVSRPVRVSRPIRNQRWVEPPRGAYRVQNRAFPRNARWQTDPRTYAAYSIYNGDVWYLDPSTGWGYTVDRWGVVYTVDPRTSWVYSLGELARWTSDLLYFFDYYSYDRGFWRADYYNDYYSYWNSPRATFYNWNTGYDRLWGFNTYFVSNTFVTQTTTFSRTFVQEVRQEVIYERANPTFVQQQTAAVGLSALQAAPPAQISTAFVPTQVSMDFVQMGDGATAAMIPVVDGQTAAFVEPLAVNAPVPVDATVFTEPVMQIVEAAPTESYEALPVQTVDSGGYTDVEGSNPKQEQPLEPLPVDERAAQADPSPYTEVQPVQGSVEPTFEDTTPYVGKESERAESGQVLESQNERGYDETTQPYQEPAADAAQPIEQQQAEPSRGYEEPAYEQPELGNEQPEQTYEQPEQRYEQPEQSDAQPEQRYEQPEQSYEQPEQRYEQPEQSYEQPEQRYEQPEQNYEQPAQRYEQPEQRYEQPEQRYEQPEPSFEQPEPSFDQPAQSYEAPEPAYEAPEPQEEDPDKGEGGY